MFNWKTGGAGGGAMLGFALGGPIGAVVGTGLGYFFGSQVDHSKAPAVVQAVTLAGDALNVTIPKGKTISLNAPQGGSVATLVPAQAGTFHGTVTVVSGIGYITGLAAGEVNVMWHDSAKKATATTVKVSVS